MGIFEQSTSLILYDPGSIDNFISLDTTNRLNLSTDKLGTIVTSGFAFEGLTTNCTLVQEKLNLRIGMYKDQESFLMAPIEGCDVILGLPWHYPIHLIPDFVEKTLTLRVEGKKIIVYDAAGDWPFPLVAERINYYAHDGDTIVEICGQAVDYLSLLKERLTNMGKLCNYKRFMIDQPQRQDLKDWMNKEALPTGSKLLVCLSLSFALWGEQSNKILDCALELKPKLIVLIAPLFSRRLDEHSTYNLIWSDDELLQNEILWPWGAMEVPSIVLDKKKGMSPTIFLWSRTDWATKHRQIASRFGHFKTSVLSGSKGQASTS
ncbi:hypothetical protein L7F22_024161 [Adiantum nelumboides]|nr:hypothetical protein [Adiantum nelumboides]